MQSFEYAAPADLEEALGLLGSAWGETEIMAGGSDLVTCLKQGIAAPKRVVSLKNIHLSGISEKNGALVVGAATTLGALAKHEAVRKHFPALVTSIKGISSPQLWAVGTVAGDLCQRPRCWYYRNGYGLLGMENGESLIPNGDNRYHAVFGNGGPAYFVCPSSLAPALVALDATLHLANADGSKATMPVAELHRTPTSQDERELALKPNQIITAIEIPMKGLKNAVYEIRPRQGLDWPLVAAAVAFSGGPDNAADGRVVLGHAAPTPWRSEAASAKLSGALSEDAAAAVGEAAAEGAEPLSKNAYKVAMVKTAVKRAVLAAMEG